MEQKLYVVNVYENMYKGLHGMQDVFLILTNNEDNMHSEATNASLEIMENYSDIYESLKSEADEIWYDTYQIEFDGSKEEHWEKWDNIYQDLKLQNVAYEYGIVNANKLQDEFDELEDELSNIGYDEFYKIYCE